MKQIFIWILLSLTGIFSAFSQPSDTIMVIKADRLFDGEAMHTDYSVAVKANKIIAVGNEKDFHLDGIVKRIELKGCTILPGLIEGHSHLFLHPYNETEWDQQVLNESIAERTARAVVHAEKTLMAGFTTVRDLGTESAGYADVGLKDAIEKGIVPGPRMIVATRAIVATGSYEPKLKNTTHIIIKGAAEADGVEGLTKEVRTQIGNGADVIKVYADFSWGLNKTGQPTFTIDELKAVVAAASSSGRKVVAHATTAEGMRRAVLAGISTIEHGDNGTAEVFDLMVKNKVPLCPTISADIAVSEYAGWKKGMPEPDRIIEKRKSFGLALQKGVTICFGGDVGVYAHGDNAREMEAMVEFGMKPVDVLKSATSINADAFGYGDVIGRIKVGLYADIIVVEGNPANNISDVRKSKLIMKDGKIYKLQQE